MAGLGKRLASFRHAGRGIFLLTTEPNARIHLGATVIVVGLGLLLNISTTDWAILVLCIGLVIAAEGINTALERIVDLASPDWHPLARDAKDLAAGAVLVTAIAAAIMGVLIFAPYLPG